jgi:hypothetical protein
MTTERTIQILGKDVSMRYCAATENGFEQLRKKPVYEIDFKSNEDLTALALSAIIAAYARKDEEPPISSDELLYDAKPMEIIELIKTVIELRAAWYDIPAVVTPDEKPTDEEEEKPKN